MIIRENIIVDGRSNSDGLFVPRLIAIFLIKSICQIFSGLVNIPRKGIMLARDNISETPLRSIKIKIKAN